MGKQNTEMKIEQSKLIKELLPKFIQEMGLEGGLDEVRISALWDQLLGPSVVSATKKKQLKGGKLYVKLDSSIVRSYLFTERKNILVKMNEAMGKRLVTDIILY